jgi:hypothetical protein
MKKVVLQASKITFYTPGELKKKSDTTPNTTNDAWNESSRDALCAVTASQASGGARLEEALRLRWEDLRLTVGRIEISGHHANTRKRRLGVAVPKRALPEKVWALPLKGFPPALIGVLWRGKKTSLPEAFLDLARKRARELM